MNCDAQENKMKYTSPQGDDTKYPTFRIFPFLRTGIICLPKLDGDVSSVT